MYLISCSWPITTWICNETLRNPRAANNTKGQVQCVLLLCYHFVGIFVNTAYMEWHCSLLKQSCLHNKNKPLYNFLPQKYLQNIHFKVFLFPFFHDSLARKRENDTGCAQLAHQVQGVNNRPVKSRQDLVTWWASRSTRWITSMTGLPFLPLQAIESYKQFGSEPSRGGGATQCCI